MPDKVVESCQQAWSDINAKPIPDGPSAAKQRSWDYSVVERVFSFFYYNIR